jgi:hypothetical protein
MTGVVYCKESESDPNRHQYDSVQRKVLLNKNGLLEFERENNKKLMEEIEVLKVRTVRSMSI